MKDNSSKNNKKKTNDAKDNNAFYFNFHTIVSISIFFYHLHDMELA